MFFEWIPLTEEEGIREVCWPGPMEFIRPEKLGDTAGRCFAAETDAAAGNSADGGSADRDAAAGASAEHAVGLTDSWYTLVNEGQGRYCQDFCANLILDKPPGYQMPSQAAAVKVAVHLS